MYNIRPATTADIPFIRLLEKELIAHERALIPSIKEGDEVYYQNIPALLADNENTIVLVIENEKEIIGCGFGQVRKNDHYYKEEYYGYIGMMSVKNGYRGNGYGPKIIERLLAWFKAKNISPVRLEVFSNNDGAVKAYKKLGFEDFSNTMEIKI